MELQHRLFARHIYVAPRGLVSTLNILVNEVSNAINNARNTIRSATSQASAGVESAIPELSILDSLPDPPPEAIMNEPIANGALWQEAFFFDTRKTGKPYQMLYQLLAYFQKMENSSNNDTPDPLTSSSWISRGLQRLRMYFTQFNQHQSDDPTTSLGEFMWSSTSSSTVADAFDSTTLVNSAADNQIIRCFWGVVAQFPQRLSSRATEESLLPAFLRGWATIERLSLQSWSQWEQ